MSKTLLLGAIASIIAINSVVANTIVTSQTYVDNADARKVDIAQGTGTNNANVGKTLVVNSSGNLELGSVNVPTLPTGTPDAVVTYDTNGDIGGERGIYNYDYAFLDEEIYDAGSYDESLDSQIPTTSVIKTALKYIAPAYGAGMGVVGSQLPDSPHTIPAFSDVDGKFARLRTVRTLDEVGSWATYNAIPTVMLMNTEIGKKQNKKTCTRWIENADETDENCLLWNLP